MFHILSRYSLCFHTFNRSPPPAPRLAPSARSGRTDHAPPKCTRSPSRCGSTGWGRTRRGRGGGARWGQAAPIASGSSSAPSSAGSGASTVRRADVAGWVSVRALACRKWRSSPFTAGPP